jgi:hypothetical protein
MDNPELYSPKVRDAYLTALNGQSQLWTPKITDTGVQSLLCNLKITKLYRAKRILTYHPESTLNL